MESETSEMRRRLGAFLRNPLIAAKVCIDRVEVLDEVGSTQDAARERCGGRAGLLVVASRQTSGRGRLGRAWADTSASGVAATFVFDSGLVNESLLPLVCGVVSASVCASALGLWPTPEFAANQPNANARGQRIGVRWPNDVVERRTDGAPGRKVAGVLIEKKDGLLFVGIGINVSQAASDWQPELRSRAVSLRELGSTITRPTVLVNLVGILSTSLRDPSSEVVTRWNSLDTLRGTRRSFEHDGKRFAGLVDSIEPTSEIVVRLDDGSTVRLPALTTSMVHE